MKLLNRKSNVFELFICLAIFFFNSELAAGQDASYLLSEDPSGLIPVIAHDFDCPFSEEEARNEIFNRFIELDLNTKSIGWPGIFLHIEYNCLYISSDNFIWALSAHFGKPVGERMELYEQPAYSSPGISPRSSAKQEILNSIGNATSSMARIFIDINR